MRILILEDNKILRTRYARILGSYAHVTEVFSISSAKKRLEKNEYDLALIDLTIHEHLDGLEVIQFAVSRGVYAVVMSAFSSEEVVGEAIECGVDDFFSKTDKEDEISLHEIILRYRGVKEKIIDKFFDDDIPIYDEEVKAQFHFLPFMSILDRTICLEGPSGIGKTKLAQKLAKIWNVRGKFVEVDCTTLTHELASSALFGHVKGAFTGAIGDRVGYLEEAKNGILFLDEVGTLSLDVQKKLLKCIDEKFFYPVGKVKKVEVDFKVISATNENLEELVSQGKFREDLYHRLMGIHVRLSSIGGNKEKIRECLKYFMKSYRRKILFKDDTMRSLIEYGWPGNLREMVNFLSQAHLTFPSIIQKSLLPKKFFKKPGK